MTVLNKKTLFKKAVSFLVAVFMIFGVMLQMMPVHVHAAAPTTYSTITADSTARVSITSSDGSYYFQFVPRVTGTYRFYSSNNTGDPYGALLNSSGNTLATSDDYNDRNFSITYECVGGTTYYIKAYLFSGTGSYTLNVQTISVVCEHDWEVLSSISATCAQEGSVNRKCSLCDETEETVVPALGHSYEGGFCTVCGAEEPEADVWDGTVDTSWYVSNQTEFTLYTAEQLAGLAQLVNSGNRFGGVTIYLGTDLDLDGLEWTPIGTSESCYFSGTLNGNGHYIYGLTINSTSLKLAGLFGSLNNATVTMLGVKDANVTITQRNIVSGAIIAGAASDSSITKCDVSGNVSVTDTGTSNGLSASAGIMVGDAGSAVIVDCCIASGSVRGTMPNDWNAYVGGIIGNTYHSGSATVVSNTYFCGQVYAYGYDDGYAGGIIGIAGNSSNASINNCFVIADITSSDYADAIAAQWQGSRPRTSNTYYSSATSSPIATSTDIANFKSQEWLSSTLGWDFDEIWEFAGESEYPVLKCFESCDHIFEETSRTEATCTENGVIVNTCTVCGATREEVIPMLEHTFEETSRTEATCVADGVIVSTCTVCGATEEEAVPATGHSYEGGSCTVCGAAEPRADVWDGTADTSWYVSDQTEFTLYTAEQLAGLAQLVNDGNNFSGITIYLGIDIDLANIEWTPIGKGILTTETSVNTGYQFRGTFDGSGYKVSNLKISENNTSYTGFFGDVQGTIKNLGIENADIYSVVTSSGRSKCGVLIGRLSNGSVSNCFVVNGKVFTTASSNPGSAGGLIGNVNSRATVENCFVQGEVECNGHSALFIGSLYSGSLSINNCYAVGSAKNNSTPAGSTAVCVAGFVAYPTSSDYGLSISNSFFCGTVDGSSETTISWGRNNNCYYNITGTVGSVSGISTSIDNFKSQEWLASTLGWDFDEIWEFAGESEYPVLQSFETCNHTFEETSRTEATCTENGVIVNTCTVCGATREETIPMLEHTFEETSRTEATCTANGVIVSTCTGCGTTEEEAIPATGHSYEEGACTVCGAEEPRADVWDGTADTSWYVSDQTEFTLYTAEQLAGLAYLVNNGNTFSGVTIYLGNNIDLDGLEWTPIGNENKVFKGIFEGEGFVISNIKIYQLNGYGGGLFGWINGATIKNLGVEDIDYSISTTSRVGGIVGVMEYSTVENCYVTGRMEVVHRVTTGGNFGVGGLVGDMRTSAVLRNCYASCDIDNKSSYQYSFAGGLVGFICVNGSKTISNCYTDSRITTNGTGVSGNGGMIGYAYYGSLVMENCFSAATVDDTYNKSIIGYRDTSSISITIRNTYYPAGGTGYTGASSTEIENFKSQAWLSSTLGWNFDETWEFTASSEYPMLKGFDAPGGSVGGGDEEESDRHTHEFEETSRTESDCSNYGEIVYTCECGSTTTVLIAPKQHNYQVTGTVDPTCTENGYIEFVCANDGCGAEKRQTLEALGHDYGSDHICDRCGHTVDLHMHEYSVETVEPTCTTMGYKEYTCHCGYSYKTSFVEPTRHNWDDGEITTEASCTAEGVTTYTCRDCGATKTTVIPSGHSWSETVTVEKTCTADGSSTKTCTVCGATETVVIPAGHNWDEGVVTLEPACKTEGTKSCTCLDCGEVEEIAIPAVGHEYYNGTCRRCGGKFIDDITPTTRPLYGMFFEIDDILSDYGPSIIDEYGLMLDYNSDAVIEKVAVYLVQDGNMWRRCIAVKGTNIEYATYVPYLSYEGEIKYSGLNHDWINIFRLSENSDGIWCYNNYATIGVNLQDAYGNLLLSMYDIGQAGAETRIFDNLGDMIAWLNEDKCEHTPGEWIVDVEPTATQTGSRHKECTSCHATVATEVMPVLATIVIDNVRAEAGKTVRVTIDVQNNPGIIGAVLTLNYNSALTLVSAEAGSAWSTLNFTRPSSFAGPCNFVWDGVEGADFSDGTIIVLTFELPEDAEEGAVYEISASYTYGNMINADLEKVNMEIENGSITVDNSIGDVNDDGVVDVADVITLRRYLAGGYGVTIDEVAADIDDDGYITVADVVLLRRLLVTE